MAEARESDVCGGGEAPFTNFDCEKAAHYCLNMELSSPLRSTKGGGGFDEHRKD